MIDAKQGLARKCNNHLQYTCAKHSPFSDGTAFNSTKYCRLVEYKYCSGIYTEEQSYRLNVRYIDLLPKQHHGMYEVAHQIYNNRHGIFRTCLHS